MPTVALCMICKNEVLNIERLLLAVLPELEEVHVVDTGSTDGTLEVLSRLRGNHTNLSVHHFDWVDDFSAARNFSFSRAGDVDFIFWLDADDMVDSLALRIFKQNRLIDASVDAWLLPYNYYKSSDGTPMLVLDRERFIRKSRNPKWLDPIHECIDISYMRKAYSKDLVIDHLRDQIGKRYDGTRNVRILKKCYESGSPSARIAYYYGKELFGMMDGEGIKVLERYLTMPGRYWDDEVNARAKLGLHYLSERRHGDAIRVVNEIYHLDNSRKRSEFYYIYGMVEKDLGNYEQALWWLSRCLVEPPKEGRVLHLDLCTWKPLQAMAECCFSLGRTVEAVDYAKKVLSYLPGDANAKKWHSGIAYRKFVPKHKSGLSVLELTTSAAVRYDSVLSTDANYESESVDGVVADLHHAAHCEDEIDRILRPGGFLWVADAMGLAYPMFKSYGCLGQATYGGRRVLNFIKPYPDKPSFWFAGYCPIDVPVSAAHRLRIHAFAMSAIKRGYPISGAPDFYVSTSLEPGLPGKVKVLEVTEKLPHYSSYGIEHADVVNCSSPMLAGYLRGLVPENIRVISVEDPFDSQAEFWL